jgi:hypothetical protein
MLGREVWYIDTNLPKGPSFLGCKNILINATIVQVLRRRNQQFPPRRGTHVKKYTASHSLAPYY